MAWWPFGWRETKASTAGLVISAWNLGQPVWTPRRYDRLADEAFVRNAVGHRCVRMIASAAASIPWLLSRRGVEIETHPLLDLLMRPSPSVGGHALFEALYTYLKLAGNGYIEAVGPNDARPPKELWTLRPDRMRVIVGPYGLPQGYEYEANGQKRVWQMDPLTGAGPILHLKEFHPIDDWYGLSPVEAAAYAVDRHNAASAHDKALLDNGARPSGALVFQPVNVGGVAQSAPGDVIQAAEERLRARHQGVENAGRPLVLGGNVDWKQMGLRPVDMDFAESKADAARDICAAFGVPHILIVPGQSTYNNVREAKLELYEDTVLPLVDKVVDALNAWITPRYGDWLRLGVDLDEVPALEPRREAKRTTVLSLFEKRLITRDEAREALQYEPLEGGTRFDVDAAVITALVAGYEKDATPVSALRAYLVSVGLADPAMTDEEMVTIARDEARRLAVAKEKIAIAGEVAKAALLPDIDLAEAVRDELVEGGVFPGLPAFDAAEFEADQEAAAELAAGTEPPGGNTVGA